MLSNTEIINKCYRSFKVVLVDCLGHGLRTDSSLTLSYFPVGVLFVIPFSFVSVNANANEAEYLWKTVE